MSQKKQREGRYSRRVRMRVYGVYLVQLALVVVTAVLLWLSLGKTDAISCAAAGAIYLIPHVYFARRALGHSQDETARRALAVIYISEIWKVGITALLFAAVFMLVSPLSPFSLFGTYVLLHFTGWIGQIWLNKRFQKL